MNRREVVQKIALGGAVLIVLPSVLNSCKTVRVASTVENPTTPAGSNSVATKINLDLLLTENSALNTTGGSKVVDKVIFINTGGGNIVALSAICTHRGCTVGYDSVAGNIKCPCHGAVYTTAGVVVSGPAPDPLKIMPVTKTGNSLSVNV